MVVITVVVVVLVVVFVVCVVGLVVVIAVVLVIVFYYCWSQKPNFKVWSKSVLFLLWFLLLLLRKPEIARNSQR